MTSEPPRHGYPRPQLCRRGGVSLNGTWDFALDAEGDWERPDDVVWSREIVVPYAPETEASGVHNTGFYKRCWYRKAFPRPELEDGERLFVHFGAVDYQAEVWVNGQPVARHEGGYTPFSADITAAVNDDGTQTIVVRADDDPHDLAKPRGKQDWQLHPHSIWYPRTTGIWQTVWLETVPHTWIGSVRWTPNRERWEIAFDVRVFGRQADRTRVRVRLTKGETLLADDTCTVLVGEVSRRVQLSDPGIDDYRNELLWTPSTPTLIQARLTLLSADGEVIDEVDSYTALRSIGVQGDRFLLNGRPYPLHMVLDQGYWPESGSTAPSDEALRRDVELAKAMGFNGVRKHQKIEDPRYLYWADVLGLLVWEEMPSAYRFTTASVERLAKQWTEAIARDVSHPCIVAWVPFNESWGVPELPDSPSQRHYVQSMYHLTKTLDATRPVIGNDGWEAVATDIIGIHDYDPVERMGHRYAAGEGGLSLFRRQGPAGRLLVLENPPHADQPIMITEFGGIAYSPTEGSWGYARCETAEEFAERYTTLLSAVRGFGALAGFCYTQFSDTYQEANGLLNADRTPKIPLHVIAQATRGSAHAPGGPSEWEWRERIMGAIRAQSWSPVDEMPRVAHAG